MCSQPPFFNMIPKIVIELNNLLGSELGRNIYGEPLFRWDWSEDLFWPQTKTGRIVTKTVEVPIIGGGTEKTEIPVHEYQRVRQSWKLKNQWLITRWLAPAQLAGLVKGFYIGEADPLFSEEVVREHWDRLFPDSEYPARGLHFMTDWRNKPNMLPTRRDTDLLIHQIREQMSGMSAAAVLAAMEQEATETRAAKTKTNEDMIEDSFTAFLNPNPGARGGHISFGGMQFKSKENYG